MNDRVLFPETGFTAGDAAAYYASVAKWMLPHLRARPVSFLRYPGTIDGEAFWEKDAPAFTPAWVKRFPVERRAGGDPIEYIVAGNVRTLKWIASVGGVEIHPFLHRVPKIAEATHVVFDLDPGEGADLADCCRVALLLRDALEAVKAKSYAKVSGSKGLQVYAPLAAGVTHDASEAFARFVAGEIARHHPRLAVAKMAKALRAKKVFIDWSQNANYKTTVAVYSLRAKRGRPLVSMPVTWEEVESARGLEFAPEAALQRLRHRGDLFAPVLRRGTLRPPELQTHPAPVLAAKKGRTQSGRRIFLITKTEMGNELWLDIRDKFRRWILRPDRDAGRRLIAMPAGQFPIEDEYYRAEVPRRWKGSVTIEDSGTYELIEGGDAQNRFLLWFTGKTLAGRWELRKVEPGKKHRSWMLLPVGRIEN